MTPIPVTKHDGMHVAKTLKDALLRQNIPIVDVLLFGSLARGNTHQWSDVDIAVVHHKFDNKRSTERRTIRRLQKDRRFPVDVVCFHPDDLDNKLLGLAQEVKQHGIAV